jgi:hypothetical protein
MSTTVVKLFKRGMHIRIHILNWFITSFINWDKIINCILIDEMFYFMYVLTIIITCNFFAELEVQQKIIVSYMRTGVMEDSKES